MKERPYQEQIYQSNLKRARKEAVASLILGFGILVGETIQGINPSDYKAFAENLSNLASQLGITLDPYFFRNQLSGFFTAPFYPCAASAVIHISSIYKPWEDKKPLERNPRKILIPAFALTLTLFEAAQAATQNTSLDIHDLAAYAGGIITLLVGERIWDFYRNFNKQLGGEDLG